MTGVTERPPARHSSARRSSAKPDPDRLAALEEERRFLLRSLTDLDREHDAGDVDDGDYQTLKDGYTARAASVIKAIDEGRRALPPRTRVRPSRVAAWAAGVLVLAIGAGLLVARLAGQRLPGQSLTGSVAEDANSELAQARSLLGSDPTKSLALYTDVLRVDPDNVEARTYAGWLLSIQAGERGNRAVVQQAESLLDDAIRLGPGRADAYCFKAVVRFRYLQDPAGAKAALDSCEARHPPSDVASLLGSLRHDIDSALSSPSTTSATSTTTSAP